MPEKTEHSVQPRLTEIEQKLAEDDRGLSHLPEANVNTQSNLGKQIGGSQSNGQAPQISFKEDSPEVPSELAGNSLSPGTIDRISVSHLLEHSPDLIFLLGKDGRFSYLSSACQNLLGRAPKFLVRGSIKEYLPEEDYPPWQDFLRDSLSTSQEFTHRLRNNQDQYVWLESRCRKVCVDGCEMVVCISRPISNPQEGSDWSDQLADKARMGRLSSIGQLAGFILHDLRQPLTSITNYLNAGLRMLKTGSPLTEDVQQALEKASLQVHHANEFLTQLREFVSAGNSVPKPTDLNKILKNTYFLCESELRKNEIQVAWKLADLPLVVVDRVLIQQVVINLIQNAIQAMLETQLTQRKLILSTHLEEKEVVVAVQDTGTGLSEEAKEKIFAPFYSTKSHGMGMGLALCQHILTESGGRIWAEPNPEAGTTFLFALPLAED